VADYDPTIYDGAAPYYVPGRPPYSRELAPLLAGELGWDGTGVLLDVGCGPGVLARLLVPFFDWVMAVDQDLPMLAEGRRLARVDGAGVARSIAWVRALGESLPLAPRAPGFRAAVFGQSFQWMDRERVAESVYDLLEPGGAFVAIAPDIDHGPPPPGPGHPPIPHDEIRAVLRRHLGERLRAGRGFRNPPADRYEDALARTRFGPPRTLHAPGRPDIVQDADGVVANYLSTSFAAPHLFGDRLGDFVADVRAVLAEHSPTGLFWDWPGDTAAVIGVKPA